MCLFVGFYLVGFGVVFCLGFLIIIFGWLVGCFLVVCLFVCYFEKNAMHSATPNKPNFVEFIN